MTKIFTDLKSLERYAKNLKHINKPLKAGSKLLQKRIVKRWIMAKGGTNKKMKPLTDKPKGAGYKSWKQKKYGRNKRDLLLTGKLHKSFYVNKIKSTEYALTFKSGQMRKAVKNYNLDNRMMKIDKGTKKAFSRMIRKALWKGVT